MVLFKTALAGAAIFAVGMLLLTMGQFVTVEVQQMQNRAVEPHAEFLVGDVVDRPYDLPARVSVFGSVDVTQAPTNASGDVQFMVFDAANYQRWSSGQQSNSLFEAEKPGQLNFTFTTPSAGTYHFAFDNRASPFKKYVVLSIGYNEVTITHVPDPRVPYLAWALLVAGIIILIFGLAKKPPVRWS
jgi:hypothetical protein